MSERQQSEAELPAIHKRAQELVVSGHLPLPYQVDAHDMRPLWDITGLAQLLDRRPDQLIDLLIQAGPVHLAGDRGIPSSWRMLVEG
jgi:hypothetical protein